MWHAWETGDMRTGFYMGRPDGKGPLVIPTLRWKDNIETNLQ